MSVSKDQSIASVPLEKTVVPGQSSSDALDQTAVPSQLPQGKRMDNRETKVIDTKPSEEGAKSSGKGTSQLGKYKLLKKLGQGGMGEVYLGEDTKLGRQAAIKVLSKALAGKSDFVERFNREARSMAKMNHDNAVSVYDVDQDNGIHYVAMEFVDGK